MNGWVILVDQARDFPNADTPHKVITTGDYLARPKLFAGLGRAKIINLSRSYNYQSKGYYASLLAEARGHRVIPTVETMLDLRELKLYEQSLPELQEKIRTGKTRPPTRQSACQRRSHFLRWKFSSSFLVSSCDIKPSCHPPKGKNGQFGPVVQKRSAL